MNILKMFSLEIGKENILTFLNGGSLTKNQTIVFDLKLRIDILLSNFIIFIKYSTNLIK